MKNFANIVAPAAAVLALIAVQPAQAQSAATSFFVTSNGIGNGGNLGGLAGADNQCQTLAQAAGSGAKTCAPIFRPRPPMANPRSTHAIESAKVRGKMPKAKWSPRTSPTCTAPIT